MLIDILRGRGPHRQFQRGLCANQHFTRPLAESSIFKAVSRSHISQGRRAYPHFQKEARVPTTISKRPGCHQQFQRPGCQQQFSRPWSQSTIFKAMEPIKIFRGHGANQQFSRPWCLSTIFKAMEPINNFQGLGAYQHFSRPWGQSTIFKAVEPINIFRGHGAESTQSKGHWAKST